MQLSQILSEWDKDSFVDLTDLNNVAKEVHKLHAKYLKYHSTEKLSLRSKEAQFRGLRLQKYEHYTQGPSKETQHWKIPAAGKILKTEAKDWYIDADEDVNKKQLEIDLLQEKVYALESILEIIKYRSNLIKSMMDYEKWKEGVN